MAQAAELQSWKADVIQDMQQIGQPGGASKIFRSVLQRHNRISSSIYLPTESDRRLLRTGNPAEPARIMMEIFDLFIGELENCNSRKYPWSREVGEDAFDLLNFQISEQFRIIMDCLVAACNTLHEKAAPLPLSYHQMTFSTYEDLGRHLEIQWKEAYHQVAEFLFSIRCVESSTYGDPDTVPVTTIRELIVRNELLKEDSSGISGGLKDKIFDAIEVAKRTSTIPDVSFCKLICIEPGIISHMKLILRVQYIKLYEKLWVHLASLRGQASLPAYASRRICGLQQRWSSSQISGIKS